MGIPPLQIAQKRGLFGLFLKLLKTRPPRLIHACSAWPIAASDGPETKTAVLRRPFALNGNLEARRNSASFLHTQQLRF